jgi:monofunctional biosynthetic peptidoglycan transglycosylase
MQDQPDDPRDPPLSDAPSGDAPAGDAALGQAGNMRANDLSREEAADIHDVLFDSEERADGSGGGLLSRFRSGVSPSGGGPKPKPVWRRVAVFVVTWAFIAGVAFVPLSAAAVFIIGWTGPPPTFNMAGTAMKGVEVRRKWVPLKDISPHIVRAVIAAEDQQFCTHDGFDRKQIDKALKDAERGRKLRGASTISQQTAKNVFLYNGGGWVRKGFEVYFTFLVEKMWSKARIMEVYLNVAEWGDGIYGVEQASEERFDKDAVKLTQRQAAALAAVLPNPNRWRVDGSYAGGRRNGQIQTLMGVVRRDKLDVCVVKY